MATQAQIEAWNTALLEKYNAGELDADQMAQVEANWDDINFYANRPTSTIDDERYAGLQAPSGSSLTTGVIVGDKNLDQYGIHSISNPHGGSTFLATMQDGTTRPLTQQEILDMGLNQPAQWGEFYPGQGGANASPSDFNETDTSGAAWNPFGAAVHFPQTPVNQPTPIPSPTGGSGTPLVDLLATLGGNAPGSANPMDYGQATQGQGFQAMNQDGFRPMRVTAAGNAGQFSQGADPYQWQSSIEAAYPRPQPTWHPEIQQPMNTPSGFSMNTGSTPNNADGNVAYQPPQGGFPQPTNTDLLQQYLAKGTV